MHHEEKVFWSNGSLTGEGLWHSGAVDAGADHPHPLMGGSMYHVVKTVRNVWSAAGFSTLRFNFRGVGKSTGRADEGRGEKQDLVRLRTHANRALKLFLIGYSFGAWICCRLLRDNPVATSVLLVSSIAILRVRLGRTGKHRGIDDSGSGHVLRCRDPSQKSRIHFGKIDDPFRADHFYFGHEALCWLRISKGIFMKKSLILNKLVLCSDQMHRF